MPTHNRRAFVPQAILYFLRQDYPDKELIIIDDGSDSVRDLIPFDERIRYFHLSERISVGAKRNLACERARGEIIAHWDDDDWHAPHRLRYQVEALSRAEADLCGINRLLFYDLKEACGWQYIYPDGHRLWLSGSSLCYRRAAWQSNPFEDVDIGEDARFVWSGRAERIIVLPDSTFHVGIIHHNNVSPKETTGAYWRRYRAAAIKKLLGPDWDFYDRRVKDPDRGLASINTVDAETQPTPIRNVFACLVHESRECIFDLVRNLRYHDPASTILLYNGSKNPNLLDGFPFEQDGVLVHPSPQPMRWGWLHGFALDCMRFAVDNLPFDSLTIVDSDQLGIRSGYSDYLGRYLMDRADVGMLGNAPDPQPQTTRIPPAAQAWKEFDLWRPLLDQFEQGEEKFVHWSFWPSTVFLSDAARELIRLFATNERLQSIMKCSRVWATEEVILPTLVALLGYRIVANPCDHSYVKYRASYTLRQIQEAFERPGAYWVHPVPRCYDDELRKYIRKEFFNYVKPAIGGDVMEISKPESDAGLLLTCPILASMRKVEGWLEDEEADLLISATAKALSHLAEPHAIVEIGSYCGRSTIVLGSVARSISPKTRVYAIDPHDGVVGALDQQISVGEPTLHKFKRNISEAGLSNTVEIIQKHSFEVLWDKPISLLLIDGLHDYTNVARDFYHFENRVVPDGYVVFHDYADYYPGVVAFVNEILNSGKYSRLLCVKSLMVVQKR